ncbi:kynurenine 3-monooxygenase [Pseudoalteromonas sp. A25]|uniref:FAD-dependent oxidoreductase n=1 Tax=Pseudoalteromonas sp. A25 TaxID=116092 RepID=UPI001260D218|nr:NAD(P)/FAD-dependent oxidoreductase [Pseudoalteromonas sp. A25]BBN81227.1 kynurenine 3-monooxygenase [Pseudoalteromonas sp. A25]
MSIEQLNIESEIKSVVVSAQGLTKASERVAVIGGGLAGSMIALLLVQHGYVVDLYERRIDPRKDKLASGRSINLGLSKRGIQALKQVGLYEEAISRTVKMTGRVLHLPNGSEKYQPYGKNDNEILHSIDRNELNRLLLERAEESEALQLHFEHRFVNFDKANRILHFDFNGQEITTKADWVVGADGAFSAVRREMQKGERAAYNQEFLEWGYKELNLSASTDGKSRIELTALHIWPAIEGLIVSHPNLDGSHTLTLFLPFEGQESFAKIRKTEQAEAYFKQQFPSLKPWLNEILENWESHSVGSLITTRTDQWAYEDWVVLVGDACHAQYPFYGQGMNSAFEDCCLLIEKLQKYASKNQAFKAFEQQRKPHTDALAELSKLNFLELREKVRSPIFIAKKKLDLLLHRLFPKVWLPLYSMIAHTTIPYNEARKRARRQETIMNGFVGSVLVLIASCIFVNLL